MAKPVRRLPAGRAWLASLHEKSRARSRLTYDDSVQRGVAAKLDRSRCRTCTLDSRAFVRCPIGDARGRLRHRCQVSDSNLEVPTWRPEKEVGRELIRPRNPPNPADPARPPTSQARARPPRGPRSVVPRARAAGTRPAAARPPRVVDD